MKISIDIDLTPEEARKMMGLPDLEPMQKAVLDKVEAKLKQSIDEMSEPDYLFKKFVPAGIQGMEQMQNFFSELAKKSSGK